MVSYTQHSNGKRPIQRGAINEVERKAITKPINVFKRQSQYRGLGS
jgi:hypothetical protein